MQPSAETYFRFLWMCVKIAFRGGMQFYAWMTLMTAIALVGLHAYGTQLTEGMVTTSMTDHVSWGLYIANFTFGVGLAAGAVMMVIPAYLYDDEEMHDVVIVGEVVAIVAIIMCLLFVVVDLGRPEHAWHLLPGIGKFNWPMSMLSWDVLVLNGYLLINLHIAGYLLYMRYLGRKPTPRFYVPFVLLSIVWAISIHTVTAFLYSGLGGRPFWNTAILAPRFIISAFVSGPAFIIVVLHLIQRTSSSVLPRLRVPSGAINTLAGFLRVTVLANLFLVLSEVFTHFYTGGHHALSSRYLFVGLEGAYGLVPWIWTSLALNVGAAIILLSARNRANSRQWLLAACGMVFVGVWIEKGMGLIIPGFVPSTLGEIVEYTPSLVEWQVTAGIWATGFALLTVAVRVTATVYQLGARQRRFSRIEPVEVNPHDTVEEDD
jgi:Ni/Fe-hydrogenase subunit HybB-like protein